MKAHFVHALETLKDMLSEIASQAEQAVHSAVDAVEKNSPESARIVISHDNDIDDAEILIEEECLKILALYQPVASDLRQVVTILKVNNELERVGDLAVNIAERVEDMALYQEKSIEKFDFHDMVFHACEMLKRALDAMAYHEADTAEAVIGLDDALDAIHRENYKRVRDMIIKYPAEAQYYMDCLTVSRCLERIGDIATNIAEDVIYLESGRIVRHCHEGAIRR
ncbi:MAG: phosphate signaling complex protein PhoU [Victivallaceae bacterium]|nr:phosphate signaling complex protein PhoU [Victivallaceae bacterium]